MPGHVLVDKDERAPARKLFSSCVVSSKAQSSFCMVTLGDVGVVAGLELSGACALPLELSEHLNSDVY